MTSRIDTSPDAIAALQWSADQRIGMTLDVDDVVAIAAQIARLTAAMDAANERANFARLREEQKWHPVVRELTAERDEARAQVAMAYEGAARLCDDTAQEALDESGTCSRTLWTWFRGQSSAIRTFTPSDAAAALAARDAAMRNEGRRQAAEESDYDAGYLNDFGGGDVSWWHDYLRAEIARANDHWRAILAALEPEGGE